ncbi:hypothetical protein TSUD_253840 [Trifolium subterraneum]|uniref:RRM domain-containing protein n=1 Tax=Trifolium subterraneum TaxID=3900 RepID=A0A2Z6NMC2_TRISU|nr:hypothetical protein TSUD_253840 [Trifolium subterraneum]
MCQVRRRQLPEFVRVAQQECVSFFFTNFPPATTEVELRRTFGAFGRVGDLFIPSKNNSFGQKFGFVRFWSVLDVEEFLERLQHIWLGNFKLKVNVSKFRRENGKQHTTIPQVTLSRPEGLIHKRSFADVLDKRVITQELPPLHALPLPPSRVVMVDECSERLAVFKGYLVGFLRGDIDVLALSDNLLLGGFKDITVCKLGGGLVLFKSNVVGMLNHFLVSCSSWWLEWCSKVVHWSPELVSSYRRAVWASVWGVPNHLWGLDIFVKIANSFGDYINVDEATLKEARLDRGRIHMWIPATAKFVDDVVEVRTGAVSYSVRVIEDADGDREAHVYSGVIECSSVGEGSNATVEGFRHSPAYWESTGEGDSSGEGEEEDLETDGSDRGQKDVGRVLGSHCSGEDKFQERDKSPLSNLGGLSCEQPFDEANRFSPLALLEAESEEIEAQSDRRREVTLSSHFNRGVGTQSTFQNSSNSLHFLRDMENNIMSPKHVNCASSRKEHMAKEDFLGVQVGHTGAGCVDGGIGLASFKLVSPSSINSRLVYCKEGGAIQQLIKSKLIDPPLISGQIAISSLIKNTTDNLNDDLNDSAKRLVEGSGQHTPLRFPSCSHSRRSSPSSFSSFLSDLPPDSNQAGYLLSHYKLSQVFLPLTSLLDLCIVGVNLSLFLRGQGRPRGVHVVHITTLLPRKFCLELRILGFLLS